MKEEFIALEQNQIAELVPRLEGVRAIFHKWVYKIKCPQDVLIKRYKA